MNDEKNELDCIALKRQIQSNIYEQIKGMTPEEEIAFFQKRAEQGPFGDLYRSLLVDHLTRSGRLGNVV